MQLGVWDSQSLWMIWMRKDWLSSYFILELFKELKTASSWLYSPDSKGTSIDNWEGNRIYLIELNDLPNRMSLYV